MTTRSIFQIFSGVAELCRLQSDCGAIFACVRHCAASGDKSICLKLKIAQCLAIHALRASQVMKWL